MIDLYLFIKRAFCNHNYGKAGEGYILPNGEEVYGKYCFKCGKVLPVKKYFKETK